MREKTQSTIYKKKDGLSEWLVKRSPEEAALKRQLEHWQSEGLPLAQLKRRRKASSDHSVVG